MSGRHTIADDEIVLLRVPVGLRWMAEGPRVTSANFDPKPEETGKSVSCRPVADADELLQLARDPLGFRVVSLAVSEVRRLGLDVVPDPTPEDPCHAEIRPAAQLRSSRALRKKLARACVLLPRA